MDKTSIKPEHIKKFISEILKTNFELRKSVDTGSAWISIGLLASLKSFIALEPVDEVIFHQPELRKIIENAKKELKR